VTANLNKDPSNCEHQSDSTIQGTSKGQKKEEEKLIEVEGVEKWEVEKILNKRKIRGTEKYLVHVMSLNL